MAKRPRIFRFGLGTMLLLVTALAISFGYWSNRARNRKRAVEVLESAGYKVTWDSDETRSWEKKFGEFDQIRRPDDLLSQFEMRRRGWVTRCLGRHYADTVVGLSSQSDYGRFDLSRRTLTADDWRQICSLDSLRELKIGTVPSQEVLNSICRIRTLETLSVYRLPRGVAVPDLSNLQRLRRFDVQFGSISDSNAKNVARARNLEYVGGLLGVSDEGLRHLSRLTHLRGLNLAGNAYVSDEGFRQVAKIKSLEWIKLSHTKITYGTLREIAMKPNLKLIGSQTPANVLGMVKHLPADDLVYEKQLFDRSVREPLSSIGHWFSSLQQSE